MKRIIAIVLAIVMIACALPVVAMAAGCTHEGAIWYPYHGVYRCNICRSWLRPEQVNKPEPEQPAAPASPTAEQIFESNMGGYYITVKCNKNSYHSLKFGIKNFNEGLVIGSVVANTGANADTYPWVCYVEPNGEYFTNLAMQKGMSGGTHTCLNVEGAYFYSDGDGYWFRDQSASNTMTVNVAHD